MANSSRFLALPAELRNSIYESIATSDCPLRVGRNARLLAPNQRLSCTAGHGLTQTCTQVRAEYCSILQNIALAPGVTTVADVHNFDFRDLASVIQRFKPEEVALANRHRSFVAQLFVHEVGKQETANLKEWLDVCDRTGIEIGYVLRWTSFSLADFRCLEVVLQGHRECRKVWRSLGAPSTAQMFLHGCYSVESWLEKQMRPSPWIDRQGISPKTKEASCPLNKGPTELECCP